MTAEPRLEAEIDARDRLDARLERTRRWERIQAARRAQPIAELERKWSKARGRWSNHYWSLEWLDLAAAKAARLSAFFNGGEPC